MERSLLSVVVITDAQARRSGFLDNQPTQRLDFQRLALARGVPAPLTGAGNCLKRPTDKLDGTLHAGAILIRLTPPRQFHQIGQPVQAGTHGIGIVRHDPPTVRGGEGFRIRQSRSAKIYSVHLRTRKFRNLAKTKRYVIPAPRANSKTQGGTRIDSDSICHRHHSVFRVFKRSEYIWKPGSLGDVRTP